MKALSAGTLLLAIGLLAGCGSGGLTDAETVWCQTHDEAVMDAAVNLLPESVWKAESEANGEIVDRLYDDFGPPGYCDDMVHRVYTCTDALMPDIRALAIGWMQQERPSDYVRACRAAYQIGDH